MSEFFDEVVLDALLDLVKLLPFLFVTYLILELIEHKRRRYRASVRVFRLGLKSLRS